MARQLATLQKINKLEPITGADRIELATILGWHCIVKKDEFKEGDFCVYFEIDSFLPQNPVYDFLKERCTKKLPDGTEGYRIKTMRMKGVISQGLALPPEELGIKPPFIEGTDLSEKLNIVKYEPQIPACLMGEVKGYFPAWLPKTDETRVQLLQNVIDRNQGLECYITEKIDGSSITCYLKDGEFGVCSRNLDMKIPQNEADRNWSNAFCRYARENMIEEKLRCIGKNIAIQGEIYGIGIQDNPLKVNARPSVAWFNVFDVDGFRYFNFEEMKEFFNQIDLPVVPIIQTDFKLINNIDELVKIAKGKSQINPEIWREGIVIRPLIEKLDMGMAVGFGVGAGGRLTFKVVNPEYLVDVEK